MSQAEGGLRPQPGRVGRAASSMPGRGRLQEDHCIRGGGGAAGRPRDRPPPWQGLHLGDGSRARTNLDLRVFGIGSELAVPGEQLAQTAGEVRRTSCTSRSSGRSITIARRSVGSRHTWTNSKSRGPGDDRRRSRTSAGTSKEGTAGTRHTITRHQAWHEFGLTGCARCRRAVGRGRDRPGPSQHWTAGG